MNAMVILIIASLLFMLFLILLTLFILGKKKNKDVNLDNLHSNNIVNHQLPGNAAPTLTAMINYHKDHGNVEYDI